MPLRQPLTAVVAVAAVVGVGLGTAAKALGEHPGSEASPAATSPSVEPPLAAPPAASVRSDDEHVEPRSGPAVANPFDELPASRPAIVRPVVPLRHGMLRIPGGTLMMGSASPKAPANERPQQQVSVGPYWIDRTEVTVGAYSACVSAGACRRPARSSSVCTYDGGAPEWPVSCVHWAEAEAYCHFMNKRLPTEREWEFAARGPTQAVYPWGSGKSCAEALTLVSELSSRSCAPRVSRVGAHPLGASLYGVQDLSGNVEEWTADWYAEALGTPPRAGSAHVLRGGGWMSAPSMSRTTARSWGSALEAGPNVGFRCAKDDTSEP